MKILVLNIQCLCAHLAELEYHLEQWRPHIVMLQETWLNKSMESVEISNYIVVSKRDRSDGPNRGGILTLARSDFNNVAFIKNSDSEERSWHFLHMDAETILIGNWYRPGATEHDAYEKLQNEMTNLLPDATGIILSGDLNIHQARWLRFSNGNSIQGADLKALCDTFGMQQLTKEPTREQYLLDLFLTDVPGCKVRVGPYIADHKYLIANVPFPEVTSLHIKRQSFQIAKADWTSLEKALKEVDWATLRRGTAEDAVNYFMEILWYLLCLHIPYKEIFLKKKSHPWLNKRCETAISTKNDAEGTALFEEKTERMFQGNGRRTASVLEESNRKNSRLEERKQTMVAPKSRTLE